jgi:hypothetical protein
MSSKDAKEPISKAAEPTTTENVEEREEGAPAETPTRQLVEDVKLMTDLASTLPTFWSIDNLVSESNNPTGDFREGGTNTLIVELSKELEDEKKGFSTERDKAKLEDFERKLMLPLVGIKLKVEIVD